MHVRTFRKLVCAVLPAAVLSVPAVSAEAATPPAAAADAAHTGGPLSTSVYTYLDSRRGDVTVSVYDAVTGRSWWWHITVRGYTASIVKADILAALLRKSGTLTATQSRTATRMIEVSDNNAATSLFRQVGGATGLAGFNRQVAMPATAVSRSWGLTTTSSRDQVTLMRRIAYPNPLLTTKQRAYEINLMRHVTPSQRWGVSAGVPRTATVALKNGWLPLRASQGGGWQVNSIGWVHGNGRDYVVGVLTHSPSFSYGIATIQGISRLVWANLAPAKR